MGAVSEEAKERKRLYDLQWNRANRDRRRAMEQRYATKHPGAIKAKRERRKPKIRAWLKADREANPEKYRERFNDWYAKNSDASLARQRQWRKENPDTTTAQNQKRRATLVAAPGNGVTRAQWRALKDEYGGRCAYCAKSGRLTMEHVDPISKGGAHDITNVAPACPRCNASKNDTTLIVWLARLAS